MVHATQMVQAAQLEVLKRRAKRPAVGEVRAYGLARTVLILEESLRREGAPSGVFEGATRVERLLVLLVKYIAPMHGICVGCLHLDDFNHRVYIITVDFRAIEIDLQEAISRFLNVPGKSGRQSVHF